MKKNLSVVCLHPLYMFAKRAQVINQVWDLDVHVCSGLFDGLV
jgi:hypothetical protein